MASLPTVLELAWLKEAGHKDRDVAGLLRLVESLASVFARAALEAGRSTGYEKTARHQLEDLKNMGEPLSLLVEGPLEPSTAQEDRVEGVGYGEEEEVDGRMAHTNVEGPIPILVSFDEVAGRLDEAFLVPFLARAHVSRVPYLSLQVAVLAF